MEFTKEFLSNLNYSGKDICIFSNQLSKILSNFGPSDFKKYSTRSYYFWLKQQRAIPLPIVLQIMDKNNLNIIAIEYFSVGSGNKIKIPSISRMLFYFLGLQLGDGCLVYRRRGVNKNTYYSQISFVTLNEAKFAKNLTRALFGIESSIYRGVGCYNLCIYSKPLVLILNKKYEVPIGEKYDKLKVPNIIKLSSSNIVKYFIKGIFESDGNIYDYRNGKSIQLRQHSEIFLEEIWTLLNRVGLNFNRPYYDKANNSWVLWTSKKELVDNFIKKIIDLKLDAPVAQPG